MTANRTIAGATWRLEGTTIVVDIPMQWKRRGGRKVIIAPDGSDAWAPAKSRPDETLIRALARAHRWKRMLEEGQYRSAREIGEAEKPDPQLREPPAPTYPACPRPPGSNPRRPAAEGDATG